MKESEDKLYEYLEGVKKRMAPEAADCKESLLKEKINNKSIIDRIKFVNCRHRFEIEVPVSLVKEKKPDDFVLTSKRDGVERFQTEELRGLIDMLEIKTDLCRDALAPVATEIFSLFF